MSTVLGVVSPHLDDAVISCSGLPARHPGSHVVTVFAEGPETVDPLPDWDHMAGFEVGADVALTRRKEDAQAAALLRFQAHYLSWWEFNYRYASRGYQGPSQDDLAGDSVRGWPLHAARQSSTGLLPGSAHYEHNVVVSRPSNRREVAVSRHGQ